MRTLTATHSFHPSAFIFRAEPLPATVPDRATNMTTAFQANAYAMGQWCLPYSVPVRRMRFASRQQS